VAFPSTQQPNTDDDLKIRVIICRVCKTIEEIPFKDPNSPGEDSYLEAYIQRHMRKGGHDGDNVVLPPAVVSKKQWDNQRVRDALLKEIRQRTTGTKFGGGQGIDLEVYASFDTFKEEAQKCFNQHGRPKEGCIDYCDRTKLLGRPTQEGRQFAKENPKLAIETGPYLCWQCPVQTWVTTQVRAKRGDYKGN
jgi:hypothetical protein